MTHGDLALAGGTMCGCVFRVRGAEFDAHTFLASASLKAYEVFRAGDPTRRPDEVYQYGGFKADASSREQLTDQVQDAITFLQAHHADLARLAAMREVEDHRLDFSCSVRPGEEILAHFDYLPPALLKLVGELGIGIEVSHYWWSEDT